MSDSFQSLFDKLVADREIEVAVVGSHAESLRSSLVRKWNVYKRQMDSLGFLSDELKNCSLSSSHSARGTTYKLKLKSGRKLYEILDPSSGNTESEQDGGN